MIFSALVFVAIPRLTKCSIRKLLEAEPEASVLLSLYSWLKEYKKCMKELEIPSELLEPPLLMAKNRAS